MTERRTITGTRAEADATDIRALQGPAIGRRPGRLWEIDAARGIAILMMVVFHAVFDLAFFGDHDIETSQGFWRNFATVTATLFVGLAGVSLTLSYARAQSSVSREVSLFPKILRRGLWVLFWGMVLTVFTWLVMPDSYIRFGILHVIGVSIILAYPFLQWRYLSAIPAVGLILLGQMVSDIRVDHSWLVPLGIRPFGFTTLDYRPLLPWFGVALMGLSLGTLLYPSGRRIFSLPDLSQFRLVRGLAFLGQHSLLIYIIHQPILLVLLTAVGLIELSSWAPV